MAEFATICKIGVPTKEIVLLDQVIDGWDALSIDAGEKSNEIENAVGQIYKRYDTGDIPKFTFTVTGATLGLVEQLESLKAYTVGPLAFIPYGARNRYSIPLLTDGIYSVTLPANPWTALATLYSAAGGTVADVLNSFHVYAGYKADGSQGTLDFYATGGAYNATTRQLSWTTNSPGAIATRVYVNLKFAGIAAWIKTLRVDVIPGSGTYKVSIAMIPAHPGP